MVDRPDCLSLDQPLTINHPPSSIDRRPGLWSNSDIMRIEFLGTGGFHPNERRHTACVLLPEVGVAFDAGTSLFRLPAKLQVPDLHLFLSHAHLDHICGLTYLLVPLLRGEIRSCRVYATGTVLQAVRQHLFSEAVFPVWPGFELVELEPGRQYPVHGVEIAHHPLPSHPGGSRAFRVDWEQDNQPKSLAYVTDTTVDGTYTEFIRGVDLLIHECNFADDMSPWCERTGHSHTSMVAKLALDSSVIRLVLTHVDPQHPEDDPLGIDTARRIFPATELAEDGLVLDVD